MFGRTLPVIERYRRVLRLRSEGATHAEIGADIGRDREEAWRIHKAAERWLVEVTTEPEREQPAPVHEVGLVAWAAGFLDGEGCIYGYEDVQRGYRRFTFGVQVAQVRSEPLELLMQSWGGSIRAQPKDGTPHQDQWAWSIRGQAAALFLTELLPYLHVKDEAARVAIPCLFRTHQKGVPFTEHEVTARRLAVGILRKLNHRGREVI